MTAFPPTLLPCVQEVAVVEGHDRPLPLSTVTTPALAVLAIFSVVWRWTDFLWPLIVLSRRELYTLQIGLNTHAGELNVQWHDILAMTVVTMIPAVPVFVFLQRFITTGIAGAGVREEGIMRRIARRGIAKSFGAVDVIHGVDLEIAEDELVVHATAEGARSVTVLDGQPRIARGDRVHLGFDPAQAHVFGADGNRVS